MQTSLKGRDRSRLTRALALAATLLSGLLAINSGSAQQPAAAPQPFDARSAASSEVAREILARVRPSIVQIEGFFGTSTAPAFHGTGFAATPNGEFVTNFHVVAEQVHRPEKYRLAYKSTDGKTGELQVIAIDVRNDLALVRAGDFAPPALPLEPTPPAKGEHAYSIGYPLDVGLTITEGISNGKVEEAFGSRIHYAGAINAGMSGGPAFNSAGAVIGINVSGYLFQQLVSFLVPATHARDLVARAGAAPPGSDALKADAAAQMHAHSKALLGTLEGPIVTQRMANYLLPGKLTDFFDCNASGDPTPNQPVDKSFYSCSAKAGLYLQQRISSGDISFTHVVLSTDKLGSWRFAHKMSALTPATGRYGSREHVGTFACEDETVALKGFDANVVTCVRGYRRYQGLYDFTVRIVSLTQTNEGFASHLDMSGMEFEAAHVFIRRYMDSMEWRK